MSMLSFQIPRKHASSNQSKAAIKFREKKKLEVRSLTILVFRLVYDNQLIE